MKFSDNEFDWRSKESKEQQDAKINRLMEVALHIIKRDHELLDVKVGDEFDFGYFYYDGMLELYELRPIDVKLFFHFLLTQYRMIVSEKSNFVFEVTEIYPLEKSLANHAVIANLPKEDFMALPNVEEYYRLN